MTTCLPFFRRVNCSLLLAATLFSATIGFADTNPAVLTAIESAAETGSADDSSSATIHSTSPVPASPPKQEEAAAAVSNTAQSEIGNRKSEIQTRQSPAVTPTAEFPTANVAGSFLRVMAMLALVLALFIGGVWLFRNWQRFTVGRGNAPKLNILETRSLGGRHALFVVGYENERFLVASSPAGINMLTHLQSADASAAEDKPATPQQTFAATLAQVLKGKTP